MYGLYRSSRPVLFLTLSALLPILCQAKHSLDKAPGILDQLKQKTENLLQSGHKEAFSVCCITK